jgi:capsular polysaccharide biosynthesis protein
VETGNGHYIDARDIMAFFRRQWPIMLGAVGATIGIALMATALQRPMYTAAVEMAFDSQGNTDDVQQLLFGDRDLGTQERILKSSPLARQVLTAVSLPASDEDARIFLSDHVEVTNAAGTSVLQLSVTMPDAAVAAELAASMASAYLDYVKANADERLRLALGELTGAEAAVRAELDSVQQELAAGPPIEIAQSLEAERDELYARLRFIATRATELRTTNAFATPVTVIEPAVAPDTPSSPRPILNVSLGAVLGVLFAVALGVSRDLARDRVWDERSLVDADAGVWLGTVTDADQNEQDSPTFRRLRNRFLAFGGGGGCQVLGMLPVEAADEAAAVSFGLAKSLARSGRRVLLIDADLHRSPLTKMLKLRGPYVDGPLAAARAGVDLESFSRMIDGVHVVPAGVISAAGDCNSSGALLAALVGRGCSEFDQTIILAATAETEDSASIALHAEAVILVAGARVSRKANVRQVIQDARSAQATVLGFVLVQKRSRVGPRVGRATRRRPSWRRPEEETG